MGAHVKGNAPEAQKNVSIEGANYSEAIHNMNSSS